MARNGDFTMNSMKIDQISKNLNLNEEKMNEILHACGIDPRDGEVSINEAVQLMEYAKAHKNDYERKAQDYLTMASGNCTMFIDTCELLHEQFPTLLERLSPLLKQNGKQLMVPSAVESELKNLFIKHEELREKIASVLELLEQKEREGVISVVGREAETFADQQMLTIAACSLLGDTTLFITRDNSLSEDILSFNELGSVRGGRLVVNRINKHGYLSRYITAAEREAAAQGVSQLPPAC